MFFRCFKECLLQITDPETGKLIVNLSASPNGGMRGVYESG